MRKHSKVLKLGAYDPERKPSHRSDDRPLMAGERLTTEHGVHDWFDMLEEFARENELRPGCEFRLTLESPWDLVKEEDEVVVEGCEEE